MIKSCFLYKLFYSIKNQQLKTETSVMQTERADSMHNLRADKGISEHLCSGIIEQDSKVSISLATWQFTKQTKKNTLMLLLNWHDWHLFVGILN